MDLLKDKIRRTLKEYGCDRENVVDDLYKCIKKHNVEREVEIMTSKVGQHDER